MVTITDVAKDKLKSILGSNPGKYVRIYLQGAG